MIYINLLPVRAAKKKESVRFQLTVAGLVTFLVLVVSLGVYFTARSEASNMAKQLADGKEELSRLRAKVGELSKIKEQQRIVQEKLNIIKKLEVAKTEPTRLLKMVTDAIPPKAWLESIRDEGFTITLQGFAANDEVVADFMRGLAKYDDFAAVELDVVQSASAPGTGTDVVKFVLKIQKHKAPEVE